VSRVGFDCPEGSKRHAPVEPQLTFDGNQAGWVDRSPSVVEAFHLAGSAEQT
jgi:hypothetical protein